MEEFQLMLTKYAIRLYNLLVEDARGQDGIVLYETIEYCEARTREALTMLDEAELITILHTHTGTATTYMVKVW